MIILRVIFLGPKWIPIIIIMTTSATIDGQSLVELKLDLDNIPTS